jgi:hypothetical protein
MFAALRQLGGSSELPGWQRTPPLFVAGVPAAFARGGFAPSKDGTTLLHVTHEYAVNYPSGTTKLFIGASTDGLAWPPLTNTSAVNFTSGPQNSFVFKNKLLHICPYYFGYLEL